MNLDLSNLLQDWPHEPGQIKVRKIVGNDGEFKLQLRIDLGLIQMEMKGRPDGVRPHNCESLLVWYQKKAADADQKGEKFTLSEEDCAALQHEGMQYYHRYLSLFQIHEFEAVIRDTARNLALFDFVQEHAERPELSMVFQQFRPYVLMMNTRARASIHLTKENYDSAIEEITRGQRKIRKVLEESGDEETLDNSSELQFLNDWLAEIQSTRPVGRLERMRKELKQAIEQEEYERAARLRDEIKLLDKTVK